MCRLSERATHENVEHLVRPRAALFLSGRQGFVTLDEEDLKPPWTAEYDIDHTTVDIYIYI